MEQSDSNQNDDHLAKEHEKKVEEFFKPQFDNQGNLQN